MMLKKIDKLLVVKLKMIASANYTQGSVHPVTGKKPPTLDEFDPLNPGEWQIGAGGKILPRLPEGTRCGNLVMGKYGLYSPSVRKRQIEFQRGTADGTLPSEVATPWDKKIRNMAFVVSFFALILGLHNLLSLFTSVEKPLWPYSIWYNMQQKKKQREEE